MKRLVCILALIALIFSLPACGNSSSTQQSVDSLAAATDEFNSALQSLSEAQTSLLANVSEAGDFVATVTSEDVADPILLEDLHAILEVAGIYLDGVYIPEIESEAEEIRIQTQAVMDQVNQMESYQYDINSAVASVKASQQDLENKKIAENLSIKETYVGTVSTGSGYKAECTLSVTNWIKASDTEALELVWSGVAKESENMLSMNSFRDWENDGFTEANAVVMLGTLSLRNITQGFDITEESPVEFYIPISFRASSKGSLFPKMYMYTSNGGHFPVNCSPRPIMKKNFWGPTTFMMVCPAVITPNDPEGTKLDGFELIVNGDLDNPLSVGTSW